MKPHIYKRNGLWHCCCFGRPERQLIGLGFTPSQAYSDWIGWHQRKETK